MRMQKCSQFAFVAERSDPSVCLSFPCARAPMALGPLVGSVGLIAAVALLLSRDTAYERPERFVLATSPGTRKVWWAPLPGLHESTLQSKDRLPAEAQVLIDGTARCLGWACSEHSNRGLEEPVGLASGIPGTGGGLGTYGCELHRLFQRGGGNAWLYVSDPKAPAAGAASERDWGLERVSNLEVFGGGAAAVGGEQPQGLYHGEED
eukprot:Skav204961  [mRNA]  locus=scaffold3104:631419:640508:+ [translate_table: standard]